MGQVESELEYAKESSNHSLYFEAYAEPAGQLSPEYLMDVPIIVPTPLIDALFPCCLNCEVLNKPVTELVPIEELHPVILPINNQGWAVREQAVHTSQHGCCGGCPNR